MTDTHAPRGAEVHVEQKVRFNQSLRRGPYAIKCITERKHSKKYQETARAEARGTGGLGLHHSLRRGAYVIKCITERKHKQESHS